VLNLAMGNVDNHPRNTAVQRLRTGVVQLTPLYDFAPMFLDPDGLVRACQWNAGGSSQRNWTEVIDSLEVDDADREIIAREMTVFAETVARIPSLASDCGVDDAIVGRCRIHIDKQAEGLEAIRG
jgi:serine/threonine-protein kinase HipA